MSDTLDLEPIVREATARAWVLDDKANEANQVASSVRSTGLEVDYIKLSDLGERFQNVVDGQERAPDVALIDLQWTIGHSTIRLGEVEIDVTDKSRVGLKLARHLRTLDQFRRCRIVIATQYEDRDIHADLEELGMAVLIPKSLIRRLPEMVRADADMDVVDAGIAALGAIGLRLHPQSARGGNPRVLMASAKALGLEADTARLAGASRPVADIAEFLASSRDARERVTMLRLIVASLHELMGPNLPSLDKMGVELRIDLRRVLLAGTQMDLQRVLWALESRGGGGSDVYEEAV